MTKILCFILFISTFSVHAQRTLISGKIIVDDADEVINLNGFLIENLATNSRVKANTGGLFSLNVSEGDVLFFKQNGITERHLKISKSMLNKGFIEVHVNVEVIELDETKVSKLNKDMLTNLGKEESMEEKLNKKMDIVSYETHVKLNRAQDEDMVRRTIRQVGGASVGGLFNLISGKHKKVKSSSKLKKTKEESLVDLQRFFTVNYFVNDLKIPKGKIIEFLDYCYSNFNFYQLLEQNNYQEILFTIEDQAPMYLNKIKEKENE